MCLFVVECDLVFMKMSKYELISVDIHARVGSVRMEVGSHMSVFVFLQMKFDLYFLKPR